MAVVIEDIEISEAPPPQAATPQPAAPAAPAAEIDPRQLMPAAARLQWLQQRLHAD